VIYIRAIFVSLLLAAAFIGCAGRFDRPEEEKVASVTKWPSGVHPLNLPADKTIVPREYPLPAAADSGGGIEILARHRSSQKKEQSVPTDAYRIQIYNSNTYGSAMREANVANEVFDGNVWLDYEVPYYKVRVGNFYSREEAEQYLPTVIEAGYPEAWVVRVNVNVKTTNGY
jgi:hypothetical protein